MKKVISNVFLAATLLIGTSVMFTSCSKPCKDVVCENSGTEREDGDDCVCDCVTGYEGDLCETEMREKFTGTFSASDACSSSGSSAYTVTIGNSSADVSKVLISNLWELFTNPVSATVDGTSITIPSQEPDNDDWVISGTGTITGSVINLNYSVIDPNTGDVDNCSSTLTKQ